MIDIKEKYNQEVVPAMQEKFGYKNKLAAPRIIKVVVNTGFNPANKDENAQKEFLQHLTEITGQKPKACAARQSEAGFKIRQGMVIGYAVTLRRQRMYDFLNRLVHIALPRSRDFRGLNKSVIDQAGNLNIGIKEHIIFPEISAENARNIFGLQISVATSAKNETEGRELFSLLGFPIKK